MMEIVSKNIWKLMIELNKGADSYQNKCKTVFTDDDQVTDKINKLNQNIFNDIEAVSK